jgi:hypothetical protein
MRIGDLRETDAFSHPRMDLASSQEPVEGNAAWDRELQRVVAWHREDH